MSLNRDLELVQCIVERNTNLEIQARYQNTLYRDSRVQKVAMRILDAVKDDSLTYDEINVALEIFKDLVKSQMIY